MSIYSFSDSSLVLEGRFHYANDRDPIALLTANVNATPQQLSEIRHAIEANGWKCVPASADGRAVLQVDGFKRAEEVSAFLTAHNFASSPQVAAEKGDHQTKTAKEWLAHTSLKSAGLLNLIGDASLLASGLKSGRSKEITSGLLYTAGAGVLAKYGNVKTEHHVREVSERVGRFLIDQAVQLPDDCSLSNIVKDQQTGLVANTENFLYRYPSKTMLSAYALGALTMLQSGIKEKNPWSIAYGTTSVGLKTASLLIPEKHKQDDKKAHSTDNQGPVHNVVSWIQEKPLRLFGFGSMVSDILLGLSAVKEFKTSPQQKSYIFKFITTGTYILADVLMGISSKDHVNAEGRFDPDEQRRIEALAAEAIARQPKDMQVALANQVGGFLATQPEMNGTGTEIGKSIMQQVEHLSKNPWALRASETQIIQPSR